MITASVHWPILQNQQGMKVELCTYGAGIYQIVLPNQQRVTLSNANKEAYLTSAFYYGKTIGRHAGRLVVPSYMIDGVSYPVTPFRSTVTSLHGGESGLAMQNFSILSQDLQSVHMQCTSDDGAEGFPGVLTLTVIYTLDETNTLHIRYLATTTKPTLLNVTNHVYFNLSAHQQSLDQTLITLNNEYYLDIDPLFLIKGKVKSEHTIYDFSSPTAFTQRLEAFKSHPFNGIDHYFFFKDQHHSIVVSDMTSPYQLNVTTSYPGVVMYTFNNEEKDNLLGMDGHLFHRGFTLECQYPPGGIHHPWLSDSILRPNEKYDHFIAFSFTKTTP